MTFLIIAIVVGSVFFGGMLVILVGMGGERIERRERRAYCERVMQNVEIRGEFDRAERSLVG